jgi:hypothetical protein
MLVAVALLGAAFPPAAYATLSWTGPTFLSDGGTSELNAIACPSVSECVAVDGPGNVVTFDPSSPQGWTAYRVDRGEYPQAVACPTATQCTEVDARGWEVTFNPHSAFNSTRYQIDAGRVFSAVACPSASQCTATDESGNAVTFDPSTPATAVTATIGAGNLPSIACPSATQCTATDQGVSLHGPRAGPPELITFNPQMPIERKAVTALNISVFADVACPSTTECVTTAEPSCTTKCHQETITFDPQSGQMSSPVVRSQQLLVSLACATALQCTVMDLSGNEITFDPNSTSASGTARILAVHGSPSGQYPGKIACPSATLCAVVAQIGGAEVTFDPKAPGQPSAVSLDDGGPNVAVDCPTALECIGVANIEPVYSQGPVSATAVFAPGSNEPAAASIVAARGPGGISCPTATQCTVVTQSGFGRYTTYETTYNPRHPPQTLPLDRHSVRMEHASLKGVSCPTAAQCTAVDSIGRAVTFNPHRPRWHRPRRIDDGRLTGIVCPSRVQCVAIDRSGHEVTFDPQTKRAPVRVRIDGRRPLWSLSCPAASQCTAVDAAGDEVTFDPATGRRLARHRIDTPSLTAISCPSSSFCVAVDTAGNAIAGNPRGSAPWSSTHLLGASALLAVFCTSRHQCVATDDDGHAFTGRA